MKYGLPIFALMLLMGCTPTPQMVEPNPTAGKPNVLSTTTIVADVVAQVGGDFISVSVLLPAEADPHSFDPTPQDVAKIADADMVFANGAGLEEFLEPLIESAGAEQQIVHVSEGIALLETAESDHAADGHGGDPHTWMVPANVIVWTQNIADALARLDPANAASYAANAQAYILELEALDAWIREQVAQVPSTERKLLTDHRIFGYYAAAYGFEQVGAIISGYSALSEPSAQELAQIEDAIQALAVKAIFVGNTVNPNLAARVAEDTGTQLIYVYTGSLSEMGGEAATYIEYMRYNTNAIVEALK